MALGNVNQAKNGRSPQVRFALAEQAHRVHCVLSARAASEVTLQEGRPIRAGGHLAFDPQWAGYYLLVRDVEIVQKTPPVSERPSLSPADLGPEDAAGMAAVLADIKKRSDAANLAQADLPPWVQKIAPPEVQAEMAEKQAVTQETTVSAPPFPAKSSSSSAAILHGDLLARLSAAMDSEDDVELTSDMLADMVDQPEELPPLLDDVRPYDVPPPAELASQLETAVSHPAVGWEDPEALPPSARRGTDFLMVLLIVAFIIVALMLIVAIIMTM